MRSLVSPARFLALLASVLATTATAQDSGSSASADEKILEEHADTRDTPAPDIGAEDELEPFYSAIGLQKVSAGFDNVDDAINLDAVLFGFRLPTIPWFGIELNVSGTLIPGQIRESSSSSGTTCTPLEVLLDGCTDSPAVATSSQGDFAMMSYGVSAAARSPGKFFAMGKAGYRYVQTTLDQNQDDRSGNSWTVGAGYRWRDAGTYAELAYTKLTNDIDAIGFSISYSYDRAW